MNTASPANSLRTDVAIIGGGVAGSSLAVVLRRMHLDVHLVERSPRFHDRIRGETVHPWGVTEMKRLDLLALAESEASAQRQLFWQTVRDGEIASTYRWADDFPNAPFGLGVNHVELQEALLSEAIRLGAHLHRPAEVTFSPLDSDTRIDIESADESITLLPRLIVAADGERSATRAAFGGSLAYDAAHHALGGVLVRGLDLQSDRIHQVFFEGGFAFVSPQSDNRARVYTVVSTEHAQTLQMAPDTGNAMVRLLRDASPPGYTRDSWELLGPAGFFPNATATATFPESSRVVLIGDAAGRNDPSQGHGLSLVFHDVATLRDLLETASDWQEVPQVFHRHRTDVAETLRQHAKWNERQATETGPEVEGLRDRIRQSRAVDPSAAGFAGIFATGPVGLSPTSEARRIYLGEAFESEP